LRHDSQPGGGCSRIGKVARDLGRDQARGLLAKTGNGLEIIDFGRQRGVVAQMKLEEY